MVIIKRDSDEWNRMWEWLSKHPINEGIDEPTIAFNEGEIWQYMGSFRNKDNRVIHTFRHRCHQIDGERKNISVSGSQIISEDDIEKAISVK